MSVAAIQITLHDDRGRTVCKFWKQTSFDHQMQPTATAPWTVAGKPIGDKQLRHESDVLPIGNIAPMRLARHDNGVQYLEVPGLIIRWEKVEPALDRIAANLGLVDRDGVVLRDDMDAATITTSQLRALIGY